MLALAQDVSREEWLLQAAEVEISRRFKEVFGVHLGEYLARENDLVKRGKSREAVRAEFIAAHEQSHFQKISSGALDVAFSMLRGRAALAGATI